MQTWEYMFTELKERTEGKLPSNEEVHNKLNEYGKQGWELVSIKEHRDTLGLVAYFKRPMSCSGIAPSYPQS